MRFLKLSIFFIIILSVIISCQKETSGDKPEDPSLSGKLVRIHQGQDPLTDDDTLWLISYDPTGKIKQIIDSTYGDTMKVIYNAQGKIEHIDHPSFGAVQYSYDANGLLIQEDYNSGQQARYIFTYKNGVIEKISYYTNSNGPLQLWREYAYTVTSGNITNIKEYDKNGTQVGELTLTYSTLPNIFKDLAYFNYSNIMGLNYFMSSHEGLFSKNLVSSISGNGTDITLTHTPNSGQMPGKMVVHEVNHDFDYEKTTTWRFYYK